MEIGKSFDRGVGVEAREFLLTDEDFEQVRHLIHDRAGIALTEGKRELVYSRLSRRLRATGATSFGQYLKHLQSAETAEWEAFINALTTNLTSFFREAHHFDLLSQQLSSLAGRATPVTLWCSASSTGEEAYSMAITAVETLGLHPPVKIIATDIDTRVLAIAEQGIYAEEGIKLSAERLHRFFYKGAGKQLGSVRVRPEVRSLIQFSPLNLLDRHWALPSELDAIFCRNVMIYFDKETQYQILKKMAPRLRPEGLLYAGHSENFYHAREFFRLRGKTVYQLTHPGSITHSQERGRSS
ncbi:MAG: chemotaxis protein CheR [Ferrovum sp.]|nr:chemotaxis protein CheR [Ferrovum sp.]NDU87476.1 chemotaxis protein CheR [Ferrovum sp.]